MRKKKEIEKKKVIFLRRMAKIESKDTNTYIYIIKNIFCVE